MPLRVSSGDTGRWVPTDALSACSSGQIFFSVGRLLFSILPATPSWIPRLVPHGKEDEIPPSRERVVLHVKP